MKKAIGSVMKGAGLALFLVAIAGDAAGVLNWGEAYGCVLAGMLFAFNGLVVQS